MNAYQEERAAREARLMDTLTAVAPLLEGKWTVENPPDLNARLVNPDGVTVWANIVSYGATAGRLELSAGVPADADYAAGDYHGLDRPEITVSPDRDAKTLARDISRRLLPAAVEYWNAVSERIARRLAALDSRQTLATELAEIMGGKAGEWRGEWSAELPDSLRQSSTYCYGSFKPNHAATEVTVELHNLTLDRARELAALIGSWS